MMDRNKLQVNIQFVNTPCGEIILAAAGDRLCLCIWSGMPCGERCKRRLAQYLNARFIMKSSPVLERTKRQLEEYFAGNRQTFSVPLLPVGTDFQKRLWQALQEIPYGETRTYKDIARYIDAPQSVRAVGQAIGANGIGILIPCHRVVGSDRSLTGFAGGTEVKKSLLDMEARTSDAKADRLTHTADNETAFPS